MNSVSIKSIWKFISIFFLLFLLVISYNTYHLQKDKITENLYQTIKTDIQRIKYYTLLNLDRNKNVNLNELLDEEVAINPLFNSLSFTKGNAHEIIFSSNRKYISLTSKSFSFIDFYKTNDKDALCTSMQIIHINIKEGSTPYSLLYQLDTQYLKYIYTSNTDDFLILFLFISLAFFMFASYMFNTLITQPILLINKKLLNHNYIHSDTIKLKEIYNLDKRLMNDINALNLARKEIKAQSYLDELTGLYNRKSYNQRIEERIPLYKRYHDTFSLLMYDIDKFKNINDTYGHDIGDKVLIEMSNLVQSQLRESDYLFRIGGEEFLIILPKTSSETAIPIAEKIRSLIENDLNTIEDETITISIGLTQIQQNDTIETLFKRVDTLLYKSKNTGRNKISF